MIDMLFYILIYSWIKMILIKHWEYQFFALFSCVWYKLFIKPIIYSIRLICDNEQPILDTLNLPVEIFIFLFVGDQLWKDAHGVVLIQKLPLPYFIA